MKEYFTEHKSEKGRIYIIFTTSLCGFLMIYYAIQLTVPVIGDESVIMANAAWLTGRDWSLMVAQWGGLYFKPLQPLLTVPLFELLENPAMIYRLTMILQALIQVSTVPVIYLICCRHLRMGSAKLSCLIAAAVCFIPSIALYTLYYRGDFLLPVFPWYVLLFFFESSKAAKEGKRPKRILFTLLIVLCCVLAYMAHTRGIVVLIALVITALAVQILMRVKSIHWSVFLVSLAILLFADAQISDTLKQAIYSVGGVSANTFENTSVSSYLNFFSYDSLKSLFMLCVSWLNTLIATTEGLVLIGGVSVIAIGVYLIRKKIPDIKDEEKILILFSTLIFVGFFAVGALYFKNDYINLATGALTRRTDSLIYDRYAICGAGMLVFVALYVLCCRREWFKENLKIVCIALTAVVFGLFLWRCLPLVTKYTGYPYNSISLNTFQNFRNPGEIMTGAYFDEAGLVAACILGFIMMILLLIISSRKEKSMPYILLIFVLFCNLLLAQVNYTKIRKTTNDYIADSTEEVVSFLQGMEDEITEEYPYIYKEAASAIMIQFYQPQLIDYMLFGYKEEEMMSDLEDYFIICKPAEYNQSDENDIYMFDEFDYAGAQYDAVYVKGNALAGCLEKFGYKMVLAN